MFYEIRPSEQTAMLDAEGYALSYKQLYAEIKNFGRDNVKRALAFCLCENSIGSIIGYMGCLNKRIVPLLLDRKIAPELLERLVLAYQPKYIYLPEVMQIRISGYAPVYRTHGFVLLDNEQKTDIPIYEELALLLPTSGSTGSPKFVRLSYRNLESNTQAIVEYLHLDETERAITTLPMHYTYGLSVINSHLSVGATILLTEDTVMMRSFWEFARSAGATSLAGVPYTYEMLRRIHFSQIDLPDLRYMTQAGGKLLPSLHLEIAQWAKTKKKHFVVMYGQTEATARMSYLPPEKAIEKFGSIGIAIPNGKLLLLDDDGNEITKPEIVGELQYIGENVSLGYAENYADLAKEDERHGILDTGDMAKRDKDGYFYIVGRKKRFLKIFGNRVNLDETERLLKEQFSDMEIAACGEDDKMRIYITKAGKEKEIRQWIARRTHLSETAFEVVYLADIPKNEAGKTLYAKLF